MLTERTQLLMDALMHVNFAGDDGDEPRYKVGQCVELREGWLHRRTSRKRVAGARRLNNGIWQYTLVPMDPFAGGRAVNETAGLIGNV